MKTLTFTLFITLALVSCDDIIRKDKKTETRDTTKTTPETTEDSDKWKDTMVNEVINEMLRDARQPCPLEIKSYLDIDKTNGEKNLVVQIKNKSNKVVESIWFKWYGETETGVPADMGGEIIKAIGGGWSDVVIKPGSTETISFEMDESDVKKNVKTWALGIKYSDQSRWDAVSHWAKLNEKQ